MKCNICGCEEFVDMHNRKGVRCKNCRSLERTRLLWLYLEQYPINSRTKILHLAPEKGIYEQLSLKLAPENYTTADFEPHRFSYAKECKKIDLCSMEEWPADHFDLILHVHVMEHVPCNIAYPLFHIHRMLKNDGIHLCVIPFMGGKYDECFDDIGNEERTRRFGQFDHVRRFGREDIPMHLGKLLNLPEKFNAKDHFSEETLVEANIPQDHWEDFQIGTVLSLKKDDFTLASF